MKISIGAATKPTQNGSIGERFNETTYRNDVRARRFGPEQWLIRQVEFIGFSATATPSGASLQRTGHRACSWRLAAQCGGQPIAQPGIGTVSADAHRNRNR